MEFGFADPFPELVSCLYFIGVILGKRGEIRILWRTCLHHPSLSIPPPVTVGKMVGILRMAVGMMVLFCPQL